jgi:hypothetical protein
MVVGALGVITGTGGTGAAYALAGTPSKPDTACSTSIQFVRSYLRYHGPISCTKAEVIYRSAHHSASAMRRSPAAKQHSTAQPLPVTIPSPANDGTIYAPQDATQFPPGTAVTSEWDDLEANYWVEVQAFGLVANPSQGGVAVKIINPLGFDPSTGEPQATGTVAGYSGGIYLTDVAVGTLSLSAVTGSLPAGDLSISVTYPGGSGTLNPLTGSFTLVAAGAGPG